jgi:hypothetical protein
MGFLVLCGSKRHGEAYRRPYKNGLKRRHPSVNIVYKWRRAAAEKAGLRPQLPFRHIFSARITAIAAG